MAERVEIGENFTLGDYEEIAQLAPEVRELRAEARALVPRLGERTLWMVNSTATGGGVAEMLPEMVALLRELGLPTEWAVIEATEEEFFVTTKLLHNSLHGEGTGELGRAEREVYEAVNRRNASEMAGWMREGDFLVVHDPQPMPLAAMLGPELGLECIWRCHIGVDERNDRTRMAWRFLEPYAPAYRHAVFSAPEYVPDYFADRASVLYPAINPLTEKNRGLSVHRLVEVLASAALVASAGPMLLPPFEHVAQRLLPGGAFAPANMAEDIGFLHRPLVTQISRWDRLKGFAPLMRAFVRLKERLWSGEEFEPLHRRRLEIARLVLVGPDPASVSDDPEGLEVLEEITELYTSLDATIQPDIAVVALPMESRAENAFMVNAIQRSSTIVAQNSLREGFGLTIAEGMWKGIPILSNRRAVGPRHQVESGREGVLVDDPEDADALARAIELMLNDPLQREKMGLAATRRVQEHFLIFHQLREWLRLLAATVGPRSRG